MIGSSQTVGTVVMSRNVGVATVVQLKTTDDPFTMADRVRSDYMTFRTPSNQEVHVGFFAETLERDHGPRLLEAVQQIVGPKKFEAVR